jgi:lipopolysaccharide biosynthesis glycosyltransferase
LIYTTGEFKTLFETKCQNSGVKYFEKNFYKSMNQARISKLDIFDYPEINNYEKIIYIDADSIFVKDPVQMFDAIQEDMIYVVGEGNILHEAEYWGRSLFLKEDPQYSDREGISSCIMGFKNIPAIKKMFIKTKQAFYLDMYQNKLKFYDQPFLNFYFIHNNICNPTAFKQFVKSRVSAEVALKEGLTIVHFAGCPGHGNVKLELLKEFHDQLASKQLSSKEQTIFLLQQQMDNLRKQMESLLQ